MNIEDELTYLAETQNKQATRIYDLENNLDILIKKYKKDVGITKAAYEAMGLDVNRRRTSVDEDGYVHVACPGCKDYNLDGYNKDDVIEGFCYCDICAKHENW